MSSGSSLVLPPTHFTTGVATTSREGARSCLSARAARFGETMKNIVEDWDPPLQFSANDFSYLYRRLHIEFPVGQTVCGECELVLASRECDQILSSVWCSQRLRWQHRRRAHRESGTRA